MTASRTAIRRQIAKLAEIPRLLKPSVLPARWDGDAPEIRDARRQIAIQDFFYKTLPPFDLPVCLLNCDGTVVLSDGETDALPKRFDLPPRDEQGFAFREHEGVLQVVLAVRHYWPQAPDGAEWLAIAADRAFFERQAPLDVARLTASEYQLIAQLLAGYELKEAAERLGASYDTKRKQLQVVFQKFDVTNQAALARSISASLMSYLIATFSGARDHSPERKLLFRHFAGKVTMHSVTLQNGAELPIWEFGDRRGKPCLFFHGLLSPTLYCDDKVDILRRHGLRFLVAPRFFIEGFDHSDPLRFLETYTEALAEMVRHLIGGPVTCVAVNSGVSWATHFATRHPDLVKSLVIAGAPFPPSIAAPASERSMQAALASAVRQRPIVIGAIVKAYAALARSPALAARAYRHAYRESPADLAVIDQSIKAGWALSWLRLIGERSSASVVADLAVNQRGWDQDIGALLMPILFLQGADDKMSPPAPIAALAETNPNADCRIIPEVGHHLAASRFELLAGTLAEDADIEESSP
ncbi:alpha/beta fold hydrolase [Martelella limonii]|uniref:alpha/beta fold hydrolase n=1 Tax=Martelella limonii TaxID=1647649 RepID=UPI0015810574|nr:alpha/beta fold hydrolase [Martelella limonii]